MAEITKNMKISDILALNELMAPFLMQNGLSCVTCAASQAESLEDERPDDNLTRDAMGGESKEQEADTGEAQEEAAKS